MIDSDEVGRRLKAARGDREKKDISLKAGFGPSTYGRWEDGTNSIGALDLVAVCRVLGIKPSEIIGDDPPAWAAGDAPCFAGLQAVLMDLHRLMPKANPNVIELYRRHAEGMLPVVTALTAGALPLADAPQAPGMPETETEPNPRPAEKRAGRRREALPEFRFSKLPARGKPVPWIGHSAAGEGAPPELARPGACLDGVKSNAVALSTVQGDSMLDTLHDGDIIVVARFPEIILHPIRHGDGKLCFEQVRAHIRNDEMALLDLNGEGVMVKRVFFRQAGDDWSMVLASDNPDFPGFPRPVMRSDSLVIYGRVMGLAR